MNIGGLHLPFNMIDLVQIFILYLSIYGILKAARNSRFGQVLTGIGVLFGVLIAFTFVFKFAVLAHILQSLLFYLAISTVVIFQSEIRRVLATLGALLFKDRHARNAIQTRVTPEQLTEWIFTLAEKRIGALIAFERGISLHGYETSGVTLDAVLSRELLISIFTEPMPLHDGGVTIRHGRLSAAHCVFPISNQPNLSSSGMRHRAAVGLAEDTDAFVVVVSEERGLISITQNGALHSYTDNGPGTRTSVLRHIKKAMPQEVTAIEAVAEWILKRFSRKGIKS